MQACAGGIRASESDPGLEIASNQNGGNATMPDDGIFRAILIVLVLSVVAGVLATLAGDLVFHSPALERTGTGVALVCGTLYFVFRWLGRREMRRRDAAELGRQDGDQSDS